MANFMDETGLAHLWSRLKTKLAGKSDTGHKHGAGDITSGTLPVSRGGTGVTSNPSMLTNLGSTSAASVFASSPRPGVTGTLPIANGGTGATTVAAARANLGIGGKTTRLTVGTSTSGWTTKDCDYLCDGTADDVEINAALDALPATGGEVILLDGTYNISAQIEVGKSYSTLRGTGQATKLVRAFDGDQLLYLSGGHCTIEDLNIDGVSGTYTDTSNAGIYFLTTNNIFKGCIVRNNAGYGIYVGQEYNKVIGCTVTASRDGIVVSDDHNIISGNIVHSNAGNGIEVSGDHNVIDSNVSRLNAEANFYMMISEYNTINNNDFSVADGDSVTPVALYLYGTSNAYNIIGHNLIGSGTITDGRGQNEWADPPMVLGIEYRTTERWNGEVVYTKLVDCGALPAKTTKIIQHKATGLKEAVHWTGAVDVGWSIPTGTDIIAAVSALNISITTNSDYSDKTAKIQIWYTKN